jgi:uncharacterized protein YjbJ (UPF0337 family)
MALANSLKENAMNWDCIEGNWKQIEGNLREIRGKLRCNQFDVIAGRHEQLAGRILEEYGIDIDRPMRLQSEWKRNGP